MREFYNNTNPDLLFSTNVYKFDFNPRSFNDGIYLVTVVGMLDSIMSKLS